MASAGEPWGRLEASNPEGWTESYDLRESVVSIGRGAGCGIRIQHPTVSTSHCIIKRVTVRQPNGVSKRAVMVEDSSTNGTYINRLRVRKPMRLRPGDELCVSWVRGNVAKRISFKFQEATYKPKKGSVDEHYIMGDALGSGAFATVFQAVDRRSGNQVAVKVVDKRKFALATRQMGSGKADAKRDLLRDEYNILRRLSHNNIVRVYGAYEDDRTLYIVMEFVRGGELFDFIVDNGRFEEDAARAIFRQVVSAVGWLHGQGIAHRDLKPENILLQPRGGEYSAAPGTASVDGWLVKISDFGMSRLVGQGSFMKTLAGTPQYLAPEVLTQSGDEGAGYDHRVDMWSLGVILFILLSGTMPFGDHVDSVPVFDQVKQAMYAFPAEYWDEVSEQAKDLIRKLLRVDPNERLTAEETLRHPWMFEGLSDDEPAPAAVERADTQVVSSGTAQRASLRKRGRRPADADRIDPDHEV